MAVLGVDGCRAGWIGVRWDPASGDVQVDVAATIVDLVSTVAPVDVVAIDIPIGLPTDAPREAERLARARLRGRASTVFSSPAVQSLDAADYDEANRLNREALGKGLSRQAFGLFPAIRDVRAWLATDPFLGSRTYEAHPESSFAELAGEVLHERKKTPEGAGRRRSLLADVGVVLPGVPPRGAALDDLLDAGAVAWTAHRIASRTALRLPPPPDPAPPIWV